MLEPSAADIVSLRRASIPHGARTIAAACAPTCAGLCACHRRPPASSRRPKAPRRPACRRPRRPAPRRPPGPCRHAGHPRHPCAGSPAGPRPVLPGRPARTGNVGTRHIGVDAPINGGELADRQYGRVRKAAAHLTQQKRKFSPTGRIRCVIPRPRRHSPASGAGPTSTSWNGRPRLLSRNAWRVLASGSSKMTNISAVARIMVGFIRSRTARSRTGRGLLKTASPPGSGENPAHTRWPVAGRFPVAI